MTYPLGASVSRVVRALTEAGYRPELEPHEVTVIVPGSVEVDPDTGKIIDKSTAVWTRLEDCPDGLDPFVLTAWPREQYRAACPSCSPGGSPLRVGPWASDDQRAVLLCTNTGCPSWDGASTEQHVHARLENALGDVLPIATNRVTTTKRKARPWSR